MNNFLIYVALTFSYHSIVNFHIYRSVQGHPLSYIVQGHPNPNSPLVLGRLRVVVGFGDVLEWMDNNGVHYDGLPSVGAQFITQLKLCVVWC